MSVQLIRGAKGGSQQHTPVESPDNLRSIAYFRILDLVSEGEIAGLVNGQQSIYLDETPLVNSDGSANFPKAHIESRTGTQDQDAIPGFDSVENEISVGVELKSTAAWVQSITDTTLSAVRVTIGLPALSKANTSNGDINGYTIAYQIEVSTDGGAYALAYSGNFTGKTTSKYQRSHRIDLPAATSGWNVRVTRLTANANSSSIADTTTIDSYTQIVDAKLRYPNSALVALMGDASQFSNIPQRAYDLFGRIIQVPSNYDVTTRAYTGTWDGTFKPSWTDNPAWIFYDLVTHPRYGLGHLVDASMIDKWGLYKIAQYCDGLVSDGNGGQEPRLTCNVFLQTQADAYKLLNDLSTAFRGISYWAGGTIMASADMPSDPVFTYTDANVIGGQFSYSASARKARFTTALVSWNDPRNFYRTKVEYVEDADGIARYGVQQTAVTAVGCASQGQAQRLGRWMLLTSRLETDTVTFKVGLDGVLAAPGQVIRIADSARAGRRQGGRIVAATTTTVTLDKVPTVAAGDTITVGMPNGVSQTRTVLSVGGATVTTSTAFTDVPVAEAAWTVESATLAAQTFRVLSVTEDKSDAEISFTVTALAHNASKFDAVDNGTLIQVPPISALTITNQAGPSAVSLESAEVVDPAATTQLLTIAWAAVPGALAYEVEWRKDNGEWSSLGTLTGLSVDVRGAGAGDYVARVRAKGTGQAYSLYSYSNTFTLGAATTLPTTVAEIQAEANQASTSAAAANAQLADIASDNLLTPGEKPVVIRDYNVITTEQAGIDAQATAYGITTEKAAYDGKVAALTTYLGTLTTPAAWNSLSGNTTIDGPTFRQAFADVYTTRQTLLNAIYAKAKAKADAAQATANQANANTPAVVNPQFANGLTSWSPGNPVGWSVQTGGANLPDPIVNTAAVHTAGGGASATDTLYNAGHIPVVAGQQVTVTCCVREVGVNAGALGYARISWRDANNSEISVSVPSGTAQYPTCGAAGTGTYTQCVTKVIAAAPAGAQYAVAEPTITGHTAGSFLFCNVCMVAQPSTVDELPDGSVYARPRASQLSNGVISLLGSGRNAIKNGTFSANTLGTAVNANVNSGQNYDGWTVSATGTFATTIHYAGYVACRILSGFAIVGTGYTNGPSITSDRYAVVAGSSFAFRVARTVFVSSGTFAPTGVTFYQRIAIQWFAADGTTVTTTTYDTPFASSAAFATTTFTGTVPTNATTAVVYQQLYVGNTSSATTLPGSGAYVEVGFQAVEYVQSTDLSVEVNGTLSTQRNLPLVTWGNYGGGWSGLSIPYSTTTTSCTFTPSAASFVGGGDSIAYNASSLTVSGTAGSTVTYYLYYDDPGMTGGSKTLQATTNQITSLNANGRVLLGSVKVTYPTSGTGGGSGSGGCPQVDEPVVRRGPDGAEEVIRAGDVRSGDYLLLSSGRWGLVTYSEAKLQPGVRVVGSDGSTITCSASAPLETAEGPCVLAPHVRGLVLKHRRAGVMRVAEVFDADEILVQHITCENDCFWVGDYAHHNAKPPN
jgi:predicted phage tail protein